MKKTLVFTWCLLALSTGIMATKTVWNFSTEPFISLTPVGGGIFHGNITYVTDDGLTFQADGRYGWSLKADDKLQPEFDGITYTHSITTTGGVNVAPGHYTIPYQNRYFAFDVTGDSEIQVLARSYNSTPAGKIVITDHEETFVDTIGRPSQGTAKWYTFQYFGGPTRLYIYPPRWTTGNCGVNFFALTATNVVPVEAEKTEWDFSSPEYYSMNLDGNFNNKQTYTTESLLSIHGNGSYGWIYRDPDPRKALNYKGIEYLNSLEVPSGVAISSDTRYFSFPVKGNSLIEVGARSYNSTPMGKVIITDPEITFVDTLVKHSQRDYPTVHSYFYQGEATTLKLMPSKYGEGNHGLDFYFISATNVGEEDATGLKDTIKKPFVTFNQFEISNLYFLDLEVYTSSGQVVMRSNAPRIDIRKFTSGIYLVRDVKTGNTLKLIK